MDFDAILQRDWMWPKMEIIRFW